MRHLSPAFKTLLWLKRLKDLQAGWDGTETLVSRRPLQSNVLDEVKSLWHTMTWRRDGLEVIVLCTLA